MRALALVGVALLTACHGIDDPVGLDQPFVVQQGDFKPGALPSDDGAVEPRITLFTSFNSLKPSQHDAPIVGRASATAYSVGVRFADLGTGYWVRSVDAEDPFNAGEYQWQLTVDAGSELEPGLHPLEVVAFDKDGKPGPKQTTMVCLASDLPDNLNACNAKAQPPLLIASLSWNVDADLDLIALAPDGTTYDRNKRSWVVGGKQLARLDADGVSSCIGDGRRMENFVWNDAPPTAGAWNLYANLFDACGKYAAQFELTIYQRVDHADGTYALQAIRSLQGEFVRQQANGGAGNPLFLTSIDFSAP
jgi:hypothetical protein